MGMLDEERQEEEASRRRPMTRADWPPQNPLVRGLPYVTKDGEWLHGQAAAEASQEGEL